MGDIGPIRRRIILEPMPDDVPVEEPAAPTTPAEPVPDKEPVPA